MGKCGGAVLLVAGSSRGSASLPSVKILLTAMLWLSARERHAQTLTYNTPWPTRSGGCSSIRTLHAMTC